MFNQNDADKSLRGFEQFTEPALCHALNARFVKTFERHETDSEKDSDFACRRGRLAVFLRKPCTIQKLFGVFS